jgi:hypothetical protein
MRKTRILYKDNNTINDWTTSLNNYNQGTETFSFVANEDAIYIGNIAPFNHFYIKLDTPNTANTTMNLQYWSGTGFNDVAEIIDETNGLTQEGFVTFTPDKNEGWVEQDTSGSGGTIDELNAVEIYDKYWLKITFSDDLDPDCVISWIGQIFSNDDDLATEYPDLVRQNVLTAFESGKTNWEEQHVKAGEMIVRDLIGKRVITSKNQILERESFKLASVSKVAQIIFNSFGDDYVDQRADAMREYQKRIDKSIYDIDLDGDARLDPYEAKARQGFLSR